MAATKLPAISLHGIGVSPGRASGPVMRVIAELPEPATGPAPEDPPTEALRIRRAAESVARRLRAQTCVDDEARAIVEATAAMATDPMLLSRSEAAVIERRLPASRAVYDVANEVAETLAATGGYLAERVRDLRDVRDRLCAEIDGVPGTGISRPSKPSVLVAHDLAPADTAALDPGWVLALVVEEGGPTSHTAILARALGIPAVVAVPGICAEAPVGATVDGDAGVVDLYRSSVPISPAPRPRRNWNGAAATADGHDVTVLANIGSPADARTAVEAGAGGVGLFRTEFCFLSAPDEPDVAAQRTAYAEVLAPFRAKPVVVRTLDAGADKPLPFLHATDEPNPALGVRGLRAAFARPDPLKRQLDAIARAAEDTGAAVSVMAPMVATVDEAEWFTEQARAAGFGRVGVMIETPAAALSAGDLLDVVDFLSVGTNDLAQYTFAADRMIGSLAELNDPWQPTLLRLIAELGRAGRAHGKPVGVCGEAAADPLLSGLLIGLGMTSLSVSPAVLPTVGVRMGEHTMEKYGKAAHAAMSTTNPRQAREQARLALSS